MPREKLTLPQVQAIFTTYKDLSARKIAKLYGMSHSQINHIRNGRSWKMHIEYLGLKPMPEARSGKSAPTEADPETYPFHTHK